MIHAAPGERLPRAPSLCAGPAAVSRRRRILNPDGSMNKVLRALTMSAVLVAGACAPKPGSGPQPRAEPVTVEVNNQNRRDVRVFVIRSGTPVRLGTVVSGRTGVFTYRGLQPGMSETLRIGAEVIGSGANFSSEGVRVAPGERVVLRLEDLLQSSAISVRRQ